MTNKINEIKDTLKKYQTTPEYIATVKIEWEE